LLSVLWITLPFAILALMKSPRPFAERYLIFVPPVVLLLVGQGIVSGAEILDAFARRWSRRGLRWAIIISLTVGLALFVAQPLRFYYPANRAADRLGQTIEVVERQARSGDVIIISPRAFIRPLAVDGAEVLYLHEHLSPAELDDLASRYHRMWILHTSYIPPIEMQEPLDQWVQAQADRLVRVPIKAVNVLTFGIVTPAGTEEDLKDRIVVMNDLAENTSGDYEIWKRHQLLADAYQALGDYYASQGASTLAAEYRDKAEEARTAVAPP
jgi:hypothetical protein